MNSLKYQQKFPTYITIEQHRHIVLHLFLYQQLQMRSLVLMFQQFRAIFAHFLTQLAKNRARNVQKCVNMRLIEQGFEARPQIMVVEHLLKNFKSFSSIKTS